MADVTITPLDNGPYVVRGPVKLVDAEGSEFTAQGSAIALCRCGNSSAKPFCDGSHQKVNFQAVNRAKA